MISFKKIWWAVLEKTHLPTDILTVRKSYDPFLTKDWNICITILSFINLEIDIVQSFLASFLVLRVKYFVCISVFLFISYFSVCLSLPLFISISLFTPFMDLTMFQEILTDFLYTTAPLLQTTCTTFSPSTDFL